MKKLTLIFRMSLFAALLALGASCHSPIDVDQTDDNPETDPYMTVCEHVADVANAVDVYFDQSKSIEELRLHLDDIKKIPYVEDAYTTSTTLFVKIKDYGKIHYSFYPAPETFSFELDEVIPKTRKKVSSNNLIEHPFLEPKRICIANAQYIEYLLAGGKADRNYIAEVTKKVFDELGYDAQLINSAGLNFFSETIYDNYDIVFLIAHGHYDPEDNLHWIDGNEDVNKEVEDVKLTPDGIIQYKDYPQDQVTLAKYKYVGDSNSNDVQSVTFWDVSISEKFIENSQRKVNDEKRGKAIFFSVPCQSLMENDNLGNAFLSNGFGAYYGYTESNFWGQRAYFHMLNNMLSGMSLENAFNALPDYYRDEWRTTDQELLNSEEPPLASLRHLPEESNAEIYKTCIIKPIISNQKPEDRSDTQIRLSGTAPYWSLYYDTFTKETESGEVENYMTFTQLDPNPFNYGFYISETSDFKNAYRVCTITPSDESNYEYSNYVVSFHYDLIYGAGNTQSIVMPGKNYYVWSYIYDGWDTYLSDMNTFTVPALSGTSIPDVPGTDF